LLERHATPLADIVPGATEQLHRAWTLMLWNGAHDSACGCSNDRVAADVDARFAEVRAIGEGIVREARLGADAPTMAQEFEGPDVPVVDWANQDGEPIGLRALTDGIEADGMTLRFFDEPDVGDLYNFCWAVEGQAPSAPDRVGVDGERFEAEWDGVLASGRAWRQRGILRVAGLIRNERTDHRLRAHVGLPRTTATVLAGAPFELLERPLVGEGGEGEAPSPTWPARHVVIASDVAVLHEGVFEYEVVGDAIAVALLRAVGCISRRSLPVRPWAAGPDTPTPKAQMLGETEFALGIREVSADVA
jgi:alpha-mannosidase